MLPQAGALGETADGVLLEVGCPQRIRGKWLGAAALLSTAVDT
jgi:hypothetical protein